jgi:hypothetical protein
VLLVLLLQGGSLPGKEAGQWLLLRQIILLLLLLLIATPWPVRHTHWHLIRQLAAMAVIALLTTQRRFWLLECTLCAMTQLPVWLSRHLYLLTTISAQNVA